MSRENLNCVWSLRCRLHGFLRTFAFAMLLLVAAGVRPLVAADAMRLTIVNQSGFPDDQVYFIVICSTPQGYLDFANHVLVPTPSFTLNTATMTATLAQLKTYSGDGTAAIPFPAMGSARVYFAFGKNFDQMGGFPVSGPESGPANTVPWAMFEINLSGNKFLNQSNVDFFSIAYTLTATRNSGEIVTVGIPAPSEAIFNEFASIPSPSVSTQQYGNSDIFKALIVTNAAGETVRVVSPKSAAYGNINSADFMPQAFTHFLDDYVNSYCWKPGRTFTFSSKLSSDTATYYGRISSDGLTLSIYTDAAMTIPYAVPTLPRPSNAWGMPDFQTTPGYWHNVGVASTAPATIDWGYLLYGQDGYTTGPGAYWVNDPVAMSIPVSIVRGVMHLDNGTVDWKDSAKYYQGLNGISTAAYPIFYYGKILHQYGLAGHVYALSFDDIFGADSGVGFVDPAVTLHFYPFSTGPVLGTGDYDGDHKADFLAYRAGSWYFLLSSVGYQSHQMLGPFVLGGAALSPASGDFDGDGRNDPAAYNPYSGQWQIRLSGQSYATTNLYQFGGGGADGLEPVAGDFDGDHKTDLALYNATSGVWMIRYSSNGQQLSGVFGGSGYVAMTADVDGDGRSDPLLYNTNSCLWRTVLSSSGYSQEVSATFGIPGCTPFVKDFDGDGRPDLALFHAASGRWGVVLSTLNYSVSQAQVVSFPGIAGYTPDVDDFDGDRKADLGLIASDGTRWFALSASGYFPAAGPLVFNPFE